jgi:hypothetical protein
MMGWVRQWGIVRWGLLALLIVSFAYLLSQERRVNAQADPDARTFTTGSPITLRLEDGERKNVYLTPEESEPLNFDFYPEDVDCRMSSSEGDSVSGRDISNERRLVDGDRSHWGIVSFALDRAGTYDLACHDQTGRSYPLVLAAPSAAEPEASHRTEAWFLFGGLSILFLMSLLRRRRPQGGMNRTEAAEVLAAYVAECRSMSYNALQMHLKKPKWTKVTAASGVEYALQLNVHWDNQKGGNLRVIIAINDSGIRSFMRPMSDDFILSPEGEFIGE